MYWQVEIDELAKEIEKEQLQRWEDSQEKVESCKSVADIVPGKVGNGQVREILKHCFQYESSSQFQQKLMVGPEDRMVWIEVGRYRNGERKFSTEFDL